MLDTERMFIQLRGTIAVRWATSGSLGIPVGIQLHARWSGHLPLVFYARLRARDFDASLFWPIWNALEAVIADGGASSFVTAR
jgi:hypothetical protein